MWNSRYFRAEFLAAEYWRQSEIDAGLVEVGYTISQDAAHYTVVGQLLHYTSKAKQINYTVIGAGN